jgi:hypothetical protein
MPPGKAYMKPVALVGNHPGTRDNAPFGNPDVDIWTFNHRGIEFPRVDLLFQLHPKRVFSSITPDHYEWLKQNTKIPVCMQARFPEIPMCTVYPFEEARDLVGNVHQEVNGVDWTPDRGYATSSVPLAIALAILQNRPKILMYGIEMEDNTEYFGQRECFMFWAGFAASRGILLDIHGADWMFEREFYPDTVIVTRPVPNGVRRK